MTKELEEAIKVLKVEQGVCELAICNQELRAELDKLSEQRQELLEKLDEDIEINRENEENDYSLFYSGKKIEAQQIKDFIGD